MAYSKNGHKKAPNIFTRLWSVYRHQVDPAHTESYEKMERVVKELETLEADKRRRDHRD